MADDLPRIAEMLAEAAQTRMPFGRYGPGKGTPDGVPLIDLPYEYLAWFARQGFPPGRLGELLAVVHAVKRDGDDTLLDPLRAATGGRVSLRKPRQRHWSFETGAEDT